ncbi:glycosyltransferase family 2 protein [Acinetobacter pecorum]|uniref:Glycosyltransferase family 2 protein n=1 Tax=Acinetobacter pecorum TaxID=2762215 RepID=A0ABR8VWU1_9GAMM|nr:glycosyltransferase family 2 protein [Acinetobacter pecorum]MBD8009240.1 glycosyltransferase family 2 protein [Acinetobacter pecorum]
MSSLVSIMIPVYNAESTIAMAIKSLQYQTYSNWECIIVNDGSTDKTLDILNKLAIKEPRLKIFSFNNNKGRGTARQFALEKCQGNLIAMLDADDWYYHDKLEKQVNFLNQHPEVVLVSCGMVIQRNKECVGVRGIQNEKIDHFNQPMPVPVPHASSMFRREIVNGHTYDLEFKLGQDMDFLRRILIGHQYAKLDYAGYVYDEYISNTPSKIFSSYRFSAKGYLKFFKTYPIVSIRYAILEYLKIIRLKIYTRLFGFNSIIEKRSIAITEIQKNEFLKNLEMLKNHE